MESFYALIDELIRLPPGEREPAQRRLREKFEVERAVLALDMSDFSLSVRRSGIVSHLCRIRRVQQLAGPIVVSHGGEVVKFEADNVLAVFARPLDAVRAAVAINGAIRTAPSGPSDAAPLTVGIGIDYGKILVVPGRDAFGDAVNIAHKLGEDVARAGEILVADAAARPLAESGEFRLEPLELSISGLALRAWRADRA